MKTLKFKTNIKCNGCVAKITPILNGNPEIKSWEVDIQNPDKILTVETALFDAQKIKEVVVSAGFMAEEVS